MDYRSPLILVYIISFVDLFAIGLTFPLFAPHLRDLGASHTSIGALSSLYAGIQVVSGPVVGGWSDIRGRKSILKRILLISGICYGLLGLTDSFTVIIIIRVILGIVKHIQSICKAVITDISPPEKHTDAFGKSAAVASVGFILGPFIGGHISETPNGFSYVCFFTMVLFFINIVLASYLPDEKRTSNDGSPLVNEGNSTLRELRLEISKTTKELKSIDWSKHWEGFTLRFLFSLAMTTFLTNQGLLLKEKYKLTQKYSGYVISYFSTIGTCSAFFLDKTKTLYRQNDCLTRLLSFFILLLASVVAIYMSPNIIVYLFILMPFSMSSTALRIISMELILKNSRGQNTGSLSGASNSVMSVSRFVTPVVTGVLGDKFGEESVLLVPVVSGLGGVFLCLHLKAGQRSTSSKED